MIYNFTQEEKNKIIEHYGESFYEELLKSLRIYTEKWELDIIEFVNYYSVNCIFICNSKQFGEAVLKIGNPCKEVFTEISVLKEYGGKHYCKLFDSDAENGIILEEYIKPGTRLREAQDLKKRTTSFSKIFNKLHIEPHESGIYPTYCDWVSRITEYMSKREDYKELYKLMLKAKDVCLELSDEYQGKMLLHGDLHHDNILLGDNNEYKIIDPKGVVGDPIFDISRFILNEFYDYGYVTYNFYKEHVEAVVKLLEESIQVPADTIKRCIFVEMTMVNCWNVESGEEPEMHYVLYAEAMMNE